MPAHNFYQRLKDRLDLEFHYELTALYYGRCGQHSIDPVVFFKLCLVAHLENIASDHRLIEHRSLRLDLRLVQARHRKWRWEQTFVPGGTTSASSTLPTPPTTRRLTRPPILPSPPP
uniref:transposase n=1 Tax=Pontibacter mangrovi TaxID=2589816 RepID=UPI003742395A